MTAMKAQKRMMRLRQPDGTNHFQFRLHQPRGRGGAEPDGGRGGGEGGGGGGPGDSTSPVLHHPKLLSRKKPNRICRKMLQHRELLIIKEIATPPFVSHELKR
jgi:hypothetical protein